MSSRFLRWMVLGFACLWFGMLVPVHQRGQIQLPGTATASGGGAMASHCSRPDAPCHKKSDGNGKGKDAPAGGNCAVCHFIIGLQAPPAVVTYIACLGLSRDLPAHEPFAVPLRHAALPFHGLDPPLV